MLRNQADPEGLLTGRKVPEDRTWVLGNPPANVTSGVIQVASGPLACPSRVSNGANLPAIPKAICGGEGRAWVGSALQLRCAITRKVDPNAIC
jgi:hypothetical protein